MPKFHAMPQTLIYLSKYKISDCNIDGHSNTWRFIALHLLTASNTFTTGTHENVYCYCHPLIQNIYGKIQFEMLFGFTAVAELKYIPESNSATLLHTTNTAHHHQNDKIYSSNIRSL